MLFREAFYDLFTDYVENHTNGIPFSELFPTIGNFTDNYFGFFELMGPKSLLEHSFMTFVFDSTHYEMKE